MPMNHAYRIKITQLLIIIQALLVLDNGISTVQFH